MKVGDLVMDADGLSAQMPGSPGIVIAVHDDVEIPPLVEILWNNGYISKAYADELEVCG